MHVLCVKPRSTVRAARVPPAARLHAIVIVTLVLWLMAATTSITQPASAAPSPQDAAPVEDAPPPKIDLVSATIDELEALNRLAMAENWTARALAVMRLERYDCDASSGRLRSFLLDSSWRVRAYAYACLARRGVSISRETLEAESDPRVIRAMLRARYPLSPARRDAVLAAIERSPKLIEAIVALESLAAVDTPDDPALRERMDELLHRIVIRMTRTEAGTLSGRLAEITAGPDSGRDYRWREWLRKSKAKPGYRPCALVPAVPTGTRLVERNRVASLDGPGFVAFEKYLSVMAERPMDLAILLDCTSSMWRELSDAQSSIDDLMAFLGSVTKGVRVGIVGYRDKSDEWETKAWDFTATLEEARGRLWSLSANGGGDTPESVYAAMKLALTKFSWIKDPPPPAYPPIRACVIVGDAPPHPGQISGCLDLAKRGLAAGVRFYGIVARDSEKNLKQPDNEDAPPRPPVGPRPGDSNDPVDEDAETDDAPEKDGGRGSSSEDADDNRGSDDTPNPGKPASREGESKPDESEADEGRGRRNPGRQIAPPKPPPPAAAKERSFTLFPEIAEAGGGRAEILKSQDSLVAEIAELTIADRYREEFADFFAAFRLLCR